MAVLRVLSLALVLALALTAVFAEDSGSGSGSGDADCEVSEWGTYSACSKSCGGGIQTRTRTVVTASSGEGDDCPSLSGTEICNNQLCPGSSFGQLRRRSNRMRLSGVVCSAFEKNAAREALRTAILKSAGKSSVAKGLFVILTKFCDSSFSDSSIAGASRRRRSDDAEVEYDLASEDSETLKEAQESLDESVGDNSFVNNLNDAAANTGSSDFTALSAITNAQSDDDNNNWKAALGVTMGLVALMVALAVVIYVKSNKKLQKVTDDDMEDGDLKHNVKQGSDETTPLKTESYA